MQFFKTPNIETLKAKQDTKQLLKIAVGKHKHEIRLDALRALGDLKDESATEPLIRLIQDQREEPRIRACATSVLGDLSDSRISDILMALLRDRSTEPTIQVAAAIALGTRAEIQAVELLRDVVKNPQYDDMVKYQAIYSLGKLDDMECADVFIDLLSHKLLQVPAIEVLARHQIAFEAILSQLQTAKAGWLSSVLKALGTLGDSRAIEPLIRFYEKMDASTEVRKRQRIVQDELAAETARLEQLIAETEYPASPDLSDVYYDDDSAGHSEYRYQVNKQAALINEIDEKRGINAARATIETLKREQTELGWKISKFEQEQRFSLELGAVRQALKALTQQWFETPLAADDWWRSQP